VTYDVAVVGGGIGGVTAAVRATEEGASVVLIEAGDVLGGTALFSGGGVHIWGVESWDEYLRYCPQSPELARTMVENYRRFVDWLVSTGAPGSWGSSTFRGLTLTKYQIGVAFVPDRKLAWFRYLGERIGTVLTGCRVTGLERLDNGNFRLIGVGLDLDARSVVLAAGGWQADPHRLAEQTGAPPERFVPRSVPYDVGDGLWLAQSVGAAANHEKTLYGHLLPAPPCRIGWTNYVDPGLLSAFYAEQSILLNGNGERFVDEGAGELTGETINASAVQPPGDLWIVFDEDIRRASVGFELQRSVLRLTHLRYSWMIRYLRLRGRRVVIDTLSLARDRGAVVHRARTIEELAKKLGPRALETIREFNEAVRNGTVDRLPVPRTHAPNPIRRPPFYAIKVAVGVSMTYGGVAIDERARALDGNGRPVPGLYAVPGTAGGVHHLHYGGALAPAGVFGMIAGEQAARSLAGVAAAAV
jgi:succinate dehydrogenase/fumarate reductase flavoprotein subunit